MSEDAMAAVRRGAVVWDSDLGIDGGFRWCTGRRIDDYALLIELWRLKLDGLVYVDTGTVRLNPSRLRTAPREGAA